ncbi:hypothetical protein [Paraburkholderia bannensis]|uniref:hypothetical protein n=1 Tax=Paraburkholderia bannensis TaxID=765414 RepID=UPI0004820DC8|nr:hypothetical protein [Paraburkholderia bannensis]
MRKSLLIAALSAVLPFYMSDVTAAAAPAEDPNAGASPAADVPASDTTSSATTAPDDSATGTTDAPPAESTPDAEAAAPATDDAAPETLTDTAADEPAATAEVAPTETAAEVAAPDAEAADVETTTAAAEAAPAAAAAQEADVTPEPTAPINENTGKVEVEADSHAEAKDRFAGLLAKLHQFEQDTVDELRTELLAIGTLLHLHSKASTDAALTGDYKATDLS